MCRNLVPISFCTSNVVYSFEKPISYYQAQCLAIAGQTFARAYERGGTAFFFTPLSPSLSLSLSLSLSPYLSLSISDVCSTVLYEGLCFRT